MNQSVTVPILFSNSTSAMESVNAMDEQLCYSSFHGDFKGVAVALAHGGRVAMRSLDGFTQINW